MNPDIPPRLSGVGDAPPALFGKTLLSPIEEGGQDQRCDQALETPPVIPSPQEAPCAAVSAASPAPSRLRRVVFAPIKFLLGMASCQSALGGLAIIGWTHRFMQRTVLKRWWEQSRQAGGVLTFSDFVASDSRTHGHFHWPNWLLTQNFRGAVWRGPDVSRGRHALNVLKALFHSLWTNVRLGVQGLFNTWVLTLPGCILWLFAWYSGWQNSFNKGYEQAWIGPMIGLLGITLFIAAMLYVPLAQARQAVTGDWRRFYDFRLVWTIVRRRWPACLGLAVLYSLCSVPIMVLVGVVISLPQINPKLLDATPEQVGVVLNRYFFWSAAFVLPAFVFVRWVAARIYGSTLLKAVQSGAVPEDALAEMEWQALHRLNLLQVQPLPRRHAFVRAIAWAGTRAGRITFGFATALVWFTFVAQIFIIQFFNYRGATAWLNQPLVQLPWFHHFPERLKNPWTEVFLAAAVVFLCWQIRKLVRWLKSIRGAGRDLPGHPRQSSPAVRQP